MTMQYPTPLLNALQDGAQIDARLRLAMQIAQVPGYYRQWREAARAEAPIRDIDGNLLTFGDFCCMLAGEVYAAGASLDWIHALPTHGELPAEERVHVERQARAQVFSQIAAQRCAQEEQSRIHPAPMGML